MIYRFIYKSSERERRRHTLSVSRSALDLQLRLTVYYNKTARRKVSKKRPREMCPPEHSISLFCSRANWMGDVPTHTRGAYLRTFAPRYNPPFFSIAVQNRLRRHQKILLCLSRRMVDPFWEAITRRQGVGTWDSVPPAILAAVGPDAEVLYLWTVDVASLPRSAVFSVRLGVAVLRCTPIVQIIFFQCAAYLNLVSLPRHQV
jgi:hypothetical protein